LSSSKAFAVFVRAHPEYRNAIIVGEPDYLSESLPYYLDNRLFSVEENTFMRWTRFARTRADTLTLGRLLDRLESLARDQKSIVLLALGHRAAWTDTVGSVSYRYGWRFTWTPGDRRRLAAESTPIALFARSDGDENYLVFAITGTAAGAASP